LDLYLTIKEVWFMSSLNPLPNNNSNVVNPNPPPSNTPLKVPNMPSGGTAKTPGGSAAASAANSDIQAHQLQQDVLNQEILNQEIQDQQIKNAQLQSDQTQIQIKNRSRKMQGQMNKI
jgi:hypothetical protein